MNLAWTTQRPTVPGWYWFRSVGKDPVPEMLCVCLVRGRLVVCHEDGRIGMEVGSIRRVYKWAGPIPEPGEEKS